MADVSSPPVPVTTPAAPAPYSLKQFFRLVGTPSFGAVNGEPPERKDAKETVELLESAPAPIRAEPLTPAAFVDGIQSSMIVTHREHRPVYLFYGAAGAAGPGPTLVGYDEQLLILASTADRDWLDEVNPAENPIPVAEIAETHPPLVERVALASLAERREHLERSLVERMLMRDVGDLVLDGSLVARPQDVRLTGVVKTMGTKYLEDESVLYGLPVGWRSPIFRIPPGQCAVDRYSCYVRLHDASRAAWNFALIRLEAFAPEALEPLAARAMLERQYSGSGDGRWDRHLISVATCEVLLRARRPNWFDYVR